MRRDGFTLIEMLVVLALMCIMYVAMYSPGSKFYQDRQKSACARNLQMIHMALRLYAQENHDTFPALPAAATSDEALGLLVPRYTTDTAAFRCPGTKDRAKTFSYAYYMGRHAGDAAETPLMTDRQVDARGKVQGEILFSVDGNPPGRNHRRFGGNVLFCDGHVETWDVHAPRDLLLPAGVALLNPRAER